MEPFNNFERWTQLKEYIQSQPELYQLLQDFMRYYAPLQYGEKAPAHLAEKITYLDDGRTRRVYRIGKSTEYELDCGFGKIVLACKVPAWGKHDEFKQLNSDNMGIMLTLHEAESFEIAAKKGILVPKVTGVIAGYGLISTLTQDITHGNTIPTEYNDWESEWIIMKDGQKEKICTDRKFPQLGDLDDKCQNDYYFHRLQLDE